MPGCLKRTRLHRQWSAEKKAVLPAPRALRRLYVLSRRHKPSSRTPERFLQHVERTGYRRPGTLPLSSWGHPSNPGLYLCPRSAPPVLYAATTADPVPLSETTIHLRTITIPVSDSAKLSQQSQQERVRFEE
ncbi:hypothetical protein DPMN_175123 [Dreissena polymorpha]|uniref:Uncharacterized protein n=1 Tax=Dreissena polymorpha TaxID=45954 RepID=A0A9D4E799_DREPO|nr:hypothetical protein DPMN_175123 [Dreissena polymorpha]